MPSTKIKLKYNTTEISISGPAYEAQPVSGPVRFVTGVALNGARYSYKLHNGSYRNWRMKLELNDSDFAQLESFFHNTVEGPTRDFEFTSTSGDVYTARFAEPSLSDSRLGPKLRQVTLSIDVTSAVK